MKKNSQPDTTTFIDKPDLADTLEENASIKWIVDNASTIFFVSIGLIALLSLVYRFAFADFVKSEEDFITADTTYQQFQKAKEPEKKLELLSRLNTLINRHPELHAKYDGLIAQTLINQGSFAEALPFANLAIERTETENAPFYTSFAKSTLLIAESRYEDALTETAQLSSLLTEHLKKQKSEKHLSSVNVLFAYNLLRMGMLQQQLNLKDQELKTWTEWKRLANEANNADVFQKLNSYFQDGKVNLNNYIETREKLLRNS